MYRLRFVSIGVGSRGCICLGNIDRILRASISRLHRLHHIAVKVLLEESTNINATGE